MPLRACDLVGLRGYPGLTSEKVDQPGDWLQVFWVHAMANAAQVVEVESSGDFSQDEFVGDSMRLGHPTRLAARQPKSSIPIDVQRGSPEPAAVRAILVDFDPKAIFEASAHKSSLLAVRL